MQVKSRRLYLVLRRPSGKTTPLIAARFKSQHRRQRLGRFDPLKMVIPERLQHLGAKLQRSVGAPLHTTEFRTISCHLTVAPGTNSQVSLAARAVALGQHSMAGRWTINILLIKEAMHSKHRHLAWGIGQQPVKRLVLPILVVGRMVEQTIPSGQAISPVTPPQLANRTSFKNSRIGIVVTPRNAVTGILTRRLPVNVAKHHGTKSAVMVEIITHPTVDHSIYRNSSFKSRMRPQKRHQRKQAIIGHPSNTNTTIITRHILHQPVHSIPSIRNLVHLPTVKRPTRRHSHDILTLRTITPAHILINTNIAISHQRLIDRRQSHSNVGAVNTRRALPRVIRRPRQNYRHNPRHIVGNRDDSKQLNPITHRNHRLHTRIIKRRSRRLKGPRDIAAMG